MNTDAVRAPAAEGARSEDDARTRKALLHMMEDLQREAEVVRQARRQWVDTVDSITDPLCVRDAQGRVVRCNRAYARHAGVEFPAIIGRPYWECFPRAAGPLTWMAEPASEFTAPGGEIFVTRAYELRDSLGNRGHMLHVFSDVTDRRRAEQKLRLATKVVENSSTVVYRTVPRFGGALDYVSENVSQFGCSAEELLSGAARYDALVHPADLARITEEHRSRAAAGDDRFAIEYRIVTRAGAIRWVEDRIALERDAAGRVICQQGVMVDITERKAAEAEIRVLARFPDENPNVVMRVAADGTLLYANPASAAVRAYFGGTVGGRIGEDWARVLRMCLAEGKVRSEEILHDGRWFSLTLAPIASEGYVNVYGVDVTERKRYEAELVFSNTILSTQQEVALDGILVVDKDQGIISYNQRFAEMWKIPQDVIDARSDDRALASVISLLERPEEFIARVRYLYQHPDEKAQEELALKDGRTFERYSAPMVAADGAYYGRVWYFRDVTERKQAEDSMRRLNRALRTLSAGNEALVRAGDEQGLLDEMVRILTSVGGYPMAFVAYARSDEPALEVKACAGIESDYLRDHPISSADNERGRSAVARAIRLGRAEVVRDAHESPAYAPWRDFLCARGIKATVGLPLRLAQGERPFGAIGIASSEQDAFDAEELKLLEELASDLGYGIVNLRTSIERRAATEKLRRGLENTIGAIAATMESRDPYTAGHQRRVAELASAIACEMGLAPAVVEGIHFGAQIHDLGKIQVPAEILAKPTRLTSLEFELIKTHSQAGYDIIKGIDFPWPVAKMVLQHHERLDGSGYPQGLKGDAIVLEARILAVADVVEAMASHRPYRPSLGIEPALREIEEKRGRWFDPAAVDACLRLFRERRFAFADGGM